jgi:hypothetical protein
MGGMMPHLHSGKMGHLAKTGSLGITLDAVSGAVTVLAPSSKITQQKNGMC